MLTSADRKRLPATTDKTFGSMPLIDGNVNQCLPAGMFDQIRRVSPLCVAVGALVGATLALSVAPTDAAVPGACIGRSNYHAGASTSLSSGIYGARARIEFNNPDLCEDDTTSHSASTAWSMVAAPSAAYPNSAAATGWAQAGYGQFGSNSGFDASGLHAFAQHTLSCKSHLNCAGDQVSTNFGGTISQTHLYKNYYNASDGKEYMLVDDQVLAKTGYNPLGHWANGWAVQVASETLHPQSDIPCTSGDTTAFDWVQQYGSAKNRAFVNLNPVAVPYSRYHRIMTNPSSGGDGIATYTSPLGSF